VTPIRHVTLISKDNWGKIIYTVRYDSSSEDISNDSDFFCSWSIDSTPAIVMLLLMIVGFESMNFALIHHDSKNDTLLVVASFSP